MPRKITKILSSFLSLLLLLQQASFAEMAVQLNLAGHLASLHQAITIDKFRPLHLRYLEYLPQDNSFKLLIDKGSSSVIVSDPNSSVIASERSERSNLSNIPKDKLESTSKELFKYFLIGLSLPNESFWVNLRPDSPDNIIDEYLSKTDIGRIMLETDLELKKDTAKATSPDTKEGKEYWEKLYKKADELFPNSPNITIPTLTRPWIVPDEIIVRENNSSAYVYKATLKVMLEEDYLKTGRDGSLDMFKNLQRTVPMDPRLKQLNEYSTELIKELIIPKLTLSVNTSKKYSELRQVYYSLILAQWFKARYRIQFPAKKNIISTETVPSSSQETVPSEILKLIDSKDLTNLTTSKPFLKETYFNQYKDSFAKGEYNYQEPVYTLQGKVIRSYFSGGINTISVVPTVIAPTGNNSGIVKNLIKGSLTLIAGFSLATGVFTQALPAQDMTDADLAWRMIPEIREIEFPYDLNKGKIIIEGIAASSLKNLHRNASADAYLGELNENSKYSGKLEIYDSQGKPLRVLMVSDIDFDGSRQPLKVTHENGIVTINTPGAQTQSPDNPIYRFNIYVLDKVDRLCTIRVAVKLKKVSEAETVVSQGSENNSIVVTNATSIDSIPQVKHIGSFQGDPKVIVKQLKIRGELPQNDAQIKIVRIGGESIEGQKTNSVFETFAGKPIYIVVEVNNSHQSRLGFRVNGSGKIVDLRNSNNLAVYSVTPNETGRISVQVDTWNEVGQITGEIFYIDVYKALKNAPVSLPTPVVTTTTTKVQEIADSQNSLAQSLLIGLTLFGLGAGAFFIRNRKQRVKQSSAPSISSVGFGDERQANRNILKGILEIARKQSGKGLIPLSITQEEIDKRLNKFDSNKTTSFGIEEDIVLAVDGESVFELAGVKIVVVDADLLSTTEEGEQYASAGLRRGTIYISRSKFNEWQSQGILEQKVKHEQDEVAYLRQKAREQYPNLSEDFAYQRMSEFLKNTKKKAEAHVLIQKAHENALLQEQGLSQDVVNSSAASSPVRLAMEWKKGDIIKFRNNEDPREFVIRNITLRLGSQGMRNVFVIAPVSNYDLEQTINSNEADRKLIFVREQSLESNPVMPQSVEVQDQDMLRAPAFISSVDSNGLVDLFHDETSTLPQLPRYFSVDLQKSLSRTNSFTYDGGEFGDDGKLIAMGVTGYVNPENLYPITMAAAPCVFMIIYNPETKHTYYAHSMGPGLSNLNVVLKKAQRHFGKDSKVVVCIGGNNLVIDDPSDFNQDHWPKFVAMDIGVTKKLEELVKSAQDTNYQILQAIPRIIGTTMDITFDPLSGMLYVEEGERDSIGYGIKRTNYKDMLDKLRSSLENDQHSSRKGSSPVVSQMQGQSTVLSDTEAAPTNPGGIDLRFLPIITQAMTNLSSGSRLTNTIKLKLGNVNLDEEWSQIERLIDSEITPSSERLKEYIQAACVQKHLGSEDIDKIILVIANTLRCDEDRCSKSDPALMDILIILESQKTPQQLNKAFLGNV